VSGYVPYVTRRFDLSVARQTDYGWDRYSGAELDDAIVGIVGVGAIGSQVAEYCQAFDACPIDTKRDTSEVPDGVDELHGADKLDVLLEARDFLVIACPLTDETEGLIDTEAIAALHSDAVLVNIARGEIVVQDALVDALEAEELRGAALDVFEEEPLPADSPALGPRRRADHAPRGRFDPALRGAGGGGLRRHPRAVRGR
jgi:phosphoglycerate dehydrogenase-like enzyme